MAENYRVAGTGLVVGLVVGLLLGLGLAPVVSPPGGATATATVAGTVTVTVAPTEPEIMENNVAAFLARFVEMSQLPLASQVQPAGPSVTPGQEGIVQEVLANLILIRPPFIAAPDISKLEDFRQSHFGLKDFVQKYRIPSAVEESFRSAVRSEVLQYAGDTDWLVPVYMFDKGGLPLRLAVVVSSVSRQPIYDSFVRFIGLFQSGSMTAGSESEPHPLLSAVSALQDTNRTLSPSSRMYLSYTFRSFLGLEVSRMWGTLYYNVSNEVWRGTYRLNFRFEGGYDDGVFLDIFSWLAGQPAISLFHQPRLLLGFPDGYAPSPQEDLQSKVLYSKFEVSGKGSQLSDGTVSCTEKNWDVRIKSTNQAELTMDVSGSMEPHSLCTVEFRGQGELAIFSSYAILTTAYKPLVLDAKPLEE